MGVSSQEYRSPKGEFSLLQSRSEEEVVVPDTCYSSPLGLLAKSSMIRRFQWHTSSHSPLRQFRSPESQRWQMGCLMRTCFLICLVLSVFAWLTASSLGLFLFLVMYPLFVLGQFIQVNSGILILCTSKSSPLLRSPRVSPLHVLSGFCNPLNST